MVHLQETDLLFTPAELEFFAEDEEVEIVPNFQLQDLVNDDMLNIAAGTYGPFRPSSITQVPLWMALMLHKRRKCRINPPAWMAAAQLEAVLEGERNRPEKFQALPFHYQEVAHLLFTHAKDSFGGDLVQVQDLVAEVARVRRNKIQAGLRELQSALSAVKLLDLGYMEVNQIRPFFKASLDRFFRLLPLDPERQEAAEAEPTPGQRPPPRQLRRGT
ncbi:hypothetical protein WJX81_000075 [Elliptochloris bilobata]|uniref:DNA replication complex GINS protein PSF2 n=1 Tax=Elliptochloris bilobata TaxID=381761 RepID=A0AAW1QMA8_9CHLO